MLAQLISAHRSQIATLADAWLRAGAQSFSAWADGKPLAVWPAGTLIGEPDLRAAVQAPVGQSGELLVTGLAGPKAQARLIADAALLSHWSQLEAEMDSITNELIEAQDQILALYDLARSMRSHLSIPETLSALAREAARSTSRSLETTAPPCAAARRASTRSAFSRALEKMTRTPARPAAPPPPAPSNTTVNSSPPARAARPSRSESARRPASRLSRSRARSSGERRITL